jgi:membrane protease YdiL (CAAX protease family)
MPVDRLLAALGIGPLFFFLFCVAGVSVYLGLIAEISGRERGAAGQPAKTFGLPEAILATALIGFLLLNISASVSRSPQQLSVQNLVGNLFFTLLVLLIIVALLQFRGFEVTALAGFFRTSFARAIGTGAVLLFFAYPLLGLTELISRHFFGGGSSKQNIVEMFSSSQTMDERVIIIVFAVAIAPVTEEFLFRFFIYGVLKSYFGRFLGVIANALLFAAAHTHLPSFAPLLVLGICFTIVYEWSGSILVSMTMHSLFNSISLVALAFPRLFPQ